jgi:hypothetical protein
MIRCTSSILVDYVSLWKTRSLIDLGRNVKQLSLHCLFLIVDIIGTFILAICAAIIGGFIASFITSPKFAPDPLDYAVQNMRSILFDFKTVLPSLRWTIIIVWFIPAFFGRLWLITYVTCGLLLKLARRLDIGFSWFNRRFDVENHPLQCIGLIAATCLTLGYWILATASLVP